MKNSVFKKVLFLREKKVQYLLSFCMLILVVGLGYFHATKGIDLTDEGMYLSTAMRFSMDDIPFRDEFMSRLFQFNILLSPVFMLYPDISLLQMRCLGLLLHIVSLLVLFLFLSRYAPPFLTALLCAIMFFINNFYGILSPSYNSLSSDFSIITMASWLFAIRSDKGSHRFLFSALAGFFFSFVVLSYSSLAFLICIPLALIIVGLYSSDEPNIYLQSSIVFVATFGIIILIAFLLIASFGILPDFVQGFIEAKGTTRVGINGLFDKLHALFIEFCRIAPKGFVLLIIFFFSMLFFVMPSKGNKTELIFGIIGIISIIVVLFTFPVLLGKETNLVTLAFAVLHASLVLFFKSKPRFKLPRDRNWNKVKNIAIIWGLFSSLVYGMSSGMSLRACLLGATPLYVVALVALFLFVNDFLSQNNSLSIRRKVWPVVYYTVILTFLITGINFNFHYIYNEAEVEKLTTPFIKNHKLVGIYSTSEKVRIIEELLSYLNKKVKRKDYFLAYNHIPMLYFLTHTRPAYGAAWARDDWPLSIRERLLSKMIEDNRIPEYCVRMLAISQGGDSNWNVGMPYREDSPLDLYVHSNYYLERIIYPFEIWHRGSGPKLRIFNQMVPDFESSFINWKGPDTINMRDVSQVAEPLALQGYRGDFNFSCISNKWGNVIRVSPHRKSEKDGLEIQFGYILNEHGFDLELYPRQEVIFIVSARLYEKPEKPTELFIQDKTKTWERNSVIIDRTSWEQYIVSKRIRNGTIKVNFGINWKPKSSEEWFEIKLVRIYVNKKKK